MQKRKFFKIKSDSLTLTVTLVYVFTCLQFSCLFVCLFVSRVSRGVTLVGHSLLGPSCGAAARERRSVGPGHSAEVSHNEVISTDTYRVV